MHKTQSKCAWGTYHAGKFWGENGHEWFKWIHHFQILNLPIVIEIVIEISCQEILTMDSLNTALKFKWLKAIQYVNLLKMILPSSKVEQKSYH